MFLVLLDDSNDFPEAICSIYKKNQAIYISFAGY